MFYVRKKLFYLKIINPTIAKYLIFYKKYYLLQLMKLALIYLKTHLYTLIMNFFYIKFIIFF